MAINGQFSRPSLAQILTLKKYINVKKKKKKKILHISVFFFEDKGQRQNKGSDSDRLSRA